MSLGDHIRRTAPNATEGELQEALQALQAHVQYREELREYGNQGGRPVLPGGRPIWADPGKTPSGPVS